MDYRTNTAIRPANESEWRASREAERSNIGGGNGVFDLDGQSVWVEGGEELLKVGDRVCGGEGQDYDEGIVDEITGPDSCVVRWDSLVTTPCDISALKVINKA